MPLLQLFAPMPFIVVFVCLCLGQFEGKKLDHFSLAVSCLCCVLVTPSLGWGIQSYGLVFLFASNLFIGIKGPTFKDDEVTPGMIVHSGSKLH